MSDDTTVIPLSTATFPMPKGAGVPRSADVVTFPDRERRMGLAGMLHHLARQAEAGEIVSIGIVATRLGENAADPPISLYRWNVTYALIGATNFLLKTMLEQEPDSDVGGEPA